MMMMIIIIIIIIIIITTTTTKYTHNLTFLEKDKFLTCRCSTLCKAVLHAHSCCCYRMSQKRCAIARRHKKLVVQTTGRMRLCAK